MFEEALSKISAALSKGNIPYMVIGGQAVLLYGEPRLTRDIDITLGVNTDKLGKLLAILKEIPLKPIPDNIKAFVGLTMVLPTLDATTGIRVDFIFSFTPYETEAIKRAKNINILNQEVYFASVEDVIIHKIFAGRPRDLEDVRSILLRNPAIEVSYIQDWLNEFDSVNDNKDFLKTFLEILKTINP